ncbi:MAG: molybdopterin oxidoreductase, partial [Candidatus Schekmanbacteria bacterium]
MKEKLEKKKEEKKGLKSFLNPSLDRRKFLKVSGVLGSAAVAAPALLKSKKTSAASYSENTPDALETDSDVTLKHSVCLMCHSACGTRGRVKDGVLLKIDGNPYHPNNLEPDERLSYSTDPTSETAKKTNGRLCPKGQAGVQTIYDPYRIKNPLKKIGDRDSGKWKEITWEQAIDEIADILKDIWDNDTDIDSSFPEFGKVANKLVFSAGRIEHGQKEFTDRIFKNGFGTINYRNDHTSICEVSHHTAGDIVSGFKKDHWKPDVLNCEYIIWWGSNPLEASFPMNPLSRKVSAFLKNGGKMDVVDPRLSNSAAKAIQTGGRWVAPKPGTDAALALGIARWIIDNKKYDEGFLKLTQPGKTNTVTGKTEYTYSDATYLVDTSTGAFLTAEAAGLVSSGDPDADKNVVWDGAQGVIYDTVDSAEILPGAVTVNGKTCKTAFEIYKEEVEKKTIAEYADICGVDQTTIEAMADEFTSHGKKAVVDAYRGAVQHTNGAYAMMAILSLNMLIGNFDWKGG